MLSSADTLAQLSEKIQKKQISSVELTRYFLDRIKKHDKLLNSMITVCEEEAMAAAAQADQRLVRGETHPLLGLPIAHKDIFCTQGVKTSCGSKMLDNFIAPYDATVITRCNQAGMVTLGKTNMDEFAMGSSNENSFYGAVSNPWDLSKTPGGSSGGSAAIVAARLAPIATGTDTGGSIRQPAAHCGITGLKPTYGRISRYGMVAFASSLDQAGPLACSVEDAALLLSTLSGHDPKDATSSKQPVPNYLATLSDSLKGRKIGLPIEFLSPDLDKSIADALQNAARTYESLGATIHEVSLPNFQHAIPAYYVIAPAECASNLARFDGVRYGYRCEQPKDLLDLYLRSRQEGFGEEVKRRIMMGNYVLSAGYYDAYYAKAQKIRRLIANDFAKAFSEVDFILGPVTPTPAFSLGSKITDPIEMYLSDIYTIAVNLAGLPSLALPMGMKDALPVGMQLIGKHFDEALLLNAGHLFQCETDWHRNVPELFKE